MPSTSILSFWQLFLNTSSPNNYMSVSKGNTSIMRNSCSSLSTSFPLHKRTWVFVWWRYKSCCWVVKQKIDVMSNSRIWQNRPTIYLLINVIQIKSFHESTLLSLKKVFYEHKDKNPNASEAEQDSPNMMLGNSRQKNIFYRNSEKQFPIWTIFFQWTFSAVIKFRLLFPGALSWFKTHRFI